MPDLPAVAIVGAFPPPVQGVAVINRHLADRLMAAGVPTSLLPTSPAPDRHGVAYLRDKMVQGLSAVAHLAGRARTIRTVLIGLDGDTGLWLNVLQAWAARLCGQRVLVYHHSSAMLARRSWPVTLLCRGPLRPAAHIMCSVAMADRFRIRYGWRGPTLIIGNLAFVQAEEHPPRSFPVATLTLGFLSNLMRAKGVLLAVDTVRELCRRGVDCRLAIAGPFVEPDTERELRAAADELDGRITFLGRVDGAAKTAFYDSIDVFLFPSFYPHETQSLVVPEALAHAVPVIARRQHFVAETLGDDWPGLIAADAGFADCAASLVERWRDDADAYGDLSKRSLSRVAVQRELARSQLTGLLDRLAALPAEP